MLLIFELQVPGNLKNSKKNEAILKTLLSNSAIHRFAGHASGKSAFMECIMVLTPGRGLFYMGPSAL